MINDDTIKKTICKNITKYRKLAGLSQKEFAKKLGAAPSRVSSWETGANSTDIDTLFKICDILDVSINDMCGIYPDANILLSYLEQDHIKKYRALDPHGKETVDIALERETIRVKELQKQKDRIAELEASPATIIELPSRSGNRHLAEYFHDASAGGGIFILGNEATSLIAISDSDWDERTDFVIRVNGDSMKPDYMDGDNVMVSQRVELSHGDVGIFVVNGKAYIKEYGETELISRNPNSSNIIIHEHDNIVCMGKVIGKLEGEYEIINA